jgi:two-component system response regulator (stage 0 sporulation protein A)
MYNRKIKVIIVEDNVNFCQDIQNALNNDGDFEVAGIARDGQTGLEMILNTEVDVLLLDVVIPVMDGLYILEELKKAPDKKPVCIMITNVNQDAITRKALQLGADYFIVKPFDMNLVVKRVKEIFEFKNQSGVRVNTGAQPIQKLDEYNASPDDYINAVLNRIPIASNLKGYTYLKTALSLSINDRRILDRVTKTLYPAIAKECRTTSARVERAIRHAIETAWKKGYGRNYFLMIGYPDENGSKPTNSQFISSLTDLYNAKTTL